MSILKTLKVKIFADGAELKTMMEFAKNPLIQGFTTNPSLMKKEGVTHYESFAHTVLKAIPDKPISLEVFADEMLEMERQARCIAAWGTNVYVKIPITNTQGEFMGPLISKLSQAGIAVNITAIFTLEQVRQVTEVLHLETPAVVSVFAGRIADTGINPEPLLRESKRILQSKPKAELLWASSRELLNIFQAEEVGCHIITLPYEMLKKLNLIGKDLNAYSLETVAAFHKDAIAAGFTI